MNHPRGLFILFFTEMWERFSYYGMRALLTLYLTKQLLYSDKLAGSIYGAYTGLVYLTPILGGYLADKYLGYKRAIYIGGILMMFGHASLAIYDIRFFYLGLLLLILGNGFFKPNISTMLGQLYENHPEKKDSGFTIFYMGINLGAFLGSIACGYLGEVYGWHYGFGLAGIGMLIGLINFAFGKKEFSNIIIIKDTNIYTKDILSVEEKSKISIIVILSLFTMFFWLAFEQAGSSMNLFTDRYVDRNLFGFNIPASAFQSVNPLLILILAPIFAMIWNYMGKKNIEPSTPIKFIFGFIFIGIGFLALVLGSFNVMIEVSANVSMAWIIIAYLFHTIGELFLSPVGLSMVSKMAPVRYAALLMGLWFLSNAFAHYAAGALAGFMSSFKELWQFFSIFVITSSVAAISLYLIKNKLEPHMK